MMKLVLIIARKMAGQPKGYQEKRQPRRPLSWDYPHSCGFGRLYTCSCFRSNQRRTLNKLENNRQATHI